jgi:fermentation-respiration switch protein FrsA (DUF1100 family)
MSAEFMPEGKGMIYSQPMAFFSAGVVLAGRFYRNTQAFDVRQPAVLVTGSWLTVKEQMPALYAQRLAALGYAAFIFDFAGFGQSQGAPRQAEIPARKIGDIMAAAEFVSTLSFVDPDAVCHLAICASAQYALAALARGAPIRSFVSVAGWYHDAASVAPFYGGADGVSLRVDRASRALDRFTRTGEVEMVPAYKPGDELAGMFFELDYYARAERGAVPEWKNEMATLSWLYWLSFDGLRAADRVRVPTLLIHGDGCVLPENAKAIHARLNAPKRLLWTDGGQIDFYDQPALVSKAVDAAHQHFRETLLAGVRR